MRSAWWSLGLVALACADPAAPRPDVGAPPAAPATPPPAPPPAEGAPLRFVHPPGSAPTAAELEKTIQDLERWIRPALEPTNPWALAHGLLAFGKDYALPDGRKAIDVIVTDFVRTETWTRPSDKKSFEVYAFPRFSDIAEPVDPHPHTLVKSLIEAGVPLTTSWTIPARPGVKPGKVTLQKLLEDAELVLDTPENQKALHAFAWPLMASLLARSPRDRIDNANSEEKLLSSLSLQALIALEKEQGFLLGPFEAKRPDLVQKQKQFIFAHPCGGQHLIQAVILGAAHLGYPDARRRLGVQLDLLLFRWEAERTIYQTALEQAPEFAVQLRVQELKFYGHALETFALAHKKGFFEATPAHREKIGQIARDLVDTAAALEPAYRNLAPVRLKAKQSYLDLLGDGCHAVHGLREALVAFFGPS